MKIGLWLQDHRNDTEKRFNEVMDIVSKSDVDLFVFPEDAYTPFNNLLDNSDPVFMDREQAWFKEADKLAKKVGKPIIFSARQEMKREGSSYPLIFHFSYYTNPNPRKDETLNSIYFKNTMTDVSPLEFENYIEFVINDCYQFAPIVLKGQKIGMTICYDCNHSMFSALYGAQGVDILINMTGGNVNYHKWYRYNQVRAMENECFSLVTMGYESKSKENSYVYGFDPDGCNMSFFNLMDPTTKKSNLVDSVYVYDTNAYEALPDLAPSEPSENKFQDFLVEAGNISKWLDKAEKLTDFLYILKQGEDNIVFAICDGETVQVPVFVTALLYSDELKSIKNKKYIIVNRRDDLDGDDFLDLQLDPILRVRAMENYCAVVLESPTANRCYQTTSTRQSQVVKEVNGKFGIDLSRTTGPEAIWKNKNGMQARWRTTYELLIDICGRWSKEMLDDDGNSPK